MTCKLCGSRSNDAQICRNCLAYYAFTCNNCSNFCLKKSENHLCGDQQQNIPFDRICTVEGCNYESKIGEWFEPGGRTCPTHSIDFVDKIDLIDAY